MRVENIADIYNSNGEVQVQTVNLTEVINGLWSIANDNACDFSFDAIETNLTGNQSYQTMSDNKINWLTVDDDTNSDYNQDSINALQLQQQRIRVFKVAYTNGECKK